MKVLVSKEGIITIDPQGNDVIGIVDLLKEEYYSMDIDMQYVETKPVYYMDEGSFYCSSEKIATYGQNNKLDFVRKILNHFKVDFIEFKEDFDYDLFEEDKVYLNVYDCEDSIELRIKDEEKWYFASYDMEDGVYQEILRLCKDLGCDFKWEYSRFTKGDVCESCYSSNLYQFQQDGDIRGECQVCGDTTTLHSR